ncbi:MULTISPECIES: hypothetical protein [Pseudomonas]|uniref:Uncharacterized protein n=1 Tax=Pseudomonas fluorescens LMG 5329 TaxID=1324332 RepID=A0A0A1Z4J5_PSEFL|nr:MULTISPECIES: hypothetical protein [Pseudomonas]KGE67966.1 hypothetical protein K814_0110820 [Pseudomonas fluorescens LMG 5329]NWE05225.1 hypothetical protein [Pseudomonas sp. IPO3749]NWF22545.1 hypothetical protein [Pseudomonas sp. IPO3749]
MKKKLGPFAQIKNKNTITAVPITLTAAVAQPGDYVDNIMYPGLLKREAVDAPTLKLNLATWFPPSSVANPSTRDDHIDDIGDFQSGLFKSEVLIAPGPYVAEIPQNRLTQGTHTYKYAVSRSIPGGGVNKSGSATFTFIVNRIAPFDTAGIRPFPLLLPAGHSGPLTKAYFDANGGVARLRIQDYDAQGAHIGDKWELLDGPNGVVVETGDVFPDEVVLLTEAQAALWEGAKDIYYQLRTVEGNVSGVSLGLPASIAIRPAPILRAPGVKFAVNLSGSGDHLIDLDDTEAASGALVIIPNYDADRVRDNVFIEFTTSIGTRRVGPLPVSSTVLPGEFPVDYPVLEFLYGTASFGPIAMSVRYAVERGGVFYWIATTDEVTVELDLSKVGPVNPDKPARPNRNLLLPILTGAVSGLTNQLDGRDKGLDAPVKILLWTVAPLPSARAFTIHLFYSGERVAVIPVDHLNLPPSGVVDTSVPWPIIAKYGNTTAGNPLPLHYEIVTTGTSNRDISPAQGIDVAANVISFDAPTVDGAAVAGGVTIIACNAVKNVTQTGGYVEVFVPPSSSFAIGMTIPVSWQAHSNDAGNMPIAAASGTFPHTITTTTETAFGFKVRIQTGTMYIKPIYDYMTDMGSVRIKYSVPIVGTTPVDSAETLALVRTYLSGSTPTYCDGSLWP